MSGHNNERLRKIVVGILPKIPENITKHPYRDTYNFEDIYIKKIFECGAIPVGICLNNGELDQDLLSLCDCLIIPGGKKINKCYYDAIIYAHKNNIPILGICLGFQVLSIYSCVISDNDYNGNNFFELYEKLNEKNKSLLKRIQGHRNVNLEIDEISKSFHHVNIIDNKSILYDILKKDKIDVVSLHDYTPKFIGNKFIITAKHDDGIVEAIEYNDKNYFLVGVQFHTEWDKNNLIINRLIEEGKKRIK